MITISHIRITDGTLRDVILSSAGFKKQLSQFELFAKQNHLSINRQVISGQLNQAKINQVARDLQRQINERLNF